VSEQMPTTDSRSPERQQAQEEAGVKHPALPSIDGISGLLIPGRQRPGQPGEASEAMQRIAALADAVAALEVKARAEADQLKAEVADLRYRLAWRTGALEILLIGVAAIAAVIWLTHWWPR